MWFWTYTHSKSVKPCCLKMMHDATRSQSVNLSQHSFEPTVLAEIYLLNSLSLTSAIRPLLFSEEALICLARTYLYHWDNDGAQCREFLIFCFSFNSQCFTTNEWSYFITDADKSTWSPNLILEVAYLKSTTSTNIYGQYFDLKC